MSDHLDIYTEGFSFSVIEVLPFLKGRKIDDVVKGYLRAVRPSIVEIVNHPYCVHCDSQQWRVRVYLNEDKTIKNIEQEVQVGCHGEIENGHHLTCKLNNSHYESKSIVICNAKGIVKITLDEEKPKWKCRRCKTFVINGFCECKDSPSPWEEVD